MSGSLRVAALLAAGCAVGCGLLAAVPVRAAAPDGYEYVSPVPGSELVSRFNNVILRPGEVLAPASLASYHVRVEGSTSGVHPGRLELSDDQRTMVFLPDHPFDPAERVTVTVGHIPDRPAPLDDTGTPTGPAGVAAWDTDGKGSRNLRFDFQVSPLGAPAAAAGAVPFASEFPSDESTTAPDGMLPAGTESGGTDDLLINTLPAGYPAPSVLKSNQPDPGYFFLAPFSPLVTDPGHLLIVDEYAKPIFYRRLLFPATDLKREADGRIFYFTRGTLSDARPQYYVLDTRGAVVDSFATGNGYATDSHEIRILPSGHVLLMAYDPEPVRMDLVVLNGSPNASVIGLVVQELDLAKRVVFQWRSWDHFQITDTKSPLANLTSNEVDYVHGNSIALEPNGDILVSSRHLSEITRVSRRTGETVWRMGPNGRHNDFTFIGDPRGFSHQHDVRLLPDGHLTLFDNGNYLPAQYSRAVEYAIDEEHRTVTLVWQYVHNPIIYGSFMGSTQRLAGGGTLVDWGGVFGTAKVTELHPDGSVALELGFPRTNIWTYRAFRGDWRTDRITVDRTALDFAAVSPGPPADQLVTITNPGPWPVTLNYFVTAGSPYFFFPVTQEIPLAVGASVDVPVRFSPVVPGTFAGKAYIGFVSGGDVFVQDVRLSATATRIASAETNSARTRAEIATADPGDGGIHYALRRAGRVRVEMFDVRGRRIAVLLDADQGAGEHSIAWDAAGAPSGLYFCRIASPDGAEVHRVARIR